MQFDEHSFQMDWFNHRLDQHELLPFGEVTPFRILPCSIRDTLNLQEFSRSISMFFAGWKTFVFSNQTDSKNRGLCPVCRGSCVELQIDQYMCILAAWI